MLFDRQEVPSKLLSAYKPNSSAENIFIEINLRSRKWFLSCSYNPNLTLLNILIRKYKQRSRFLFIEIRQLYRTQTPLSLGFALHTI